MDNGYDFHPAENGGPHLPYSENAFSTELKTRLMMGMLRPEAGESILDIGCGISASCALLVERGLDVTGVYAGPDLPVVSPGITGNRVFLRQGNASDLPFNDNSFNHACLVSCPVIAENPRNVLEEAFRVSKDRVFIGFFNRYAVTDIGRRVKDIFTWDEGPRPTAFSIWEIKRIIRDLLGPVPIYWRTVGRPPASPADPIQVRGFFQRFPFGTFVGMVVTLVPRFRTRPLVLEYRPRRTLNQTADCITMTRFVRSGRFDDPAEPLPSSSFSTRPSAFQNNRHIFQIH